jgi:hypothetical protein
MKFAQLLVWAPCQADSAKRRTTPRYCDGRHSTRGSPLAAGEDRRTARSAQRWGAGLDHLPHPHRQIYAVGVAPPAGVRTRT